MAVALKTKERVSGIWNIGLWVIIGASIVGPVASPEMFEKGGFSVAIGAASVWACLYYINVLRWQIFYAATFICDGNGELLQYIRNDVYVLKRWLKENRAGVRYCTMPSSFRVKVRVFIVGVGEVVLSAKGQALACDPQIAFDHVIRPKVDVVETVRSALKEALLMVDSAHMTRPDLIERAREAIEQKIPKQVLRVHMVFAVKCADRLVVSL